MQEQVYNDVRDDSAERLFNEVRDLGLTQNRAQDLIEQRMNTMTEQGRIMLMSDEEERLVKSFRRFKLNIRKAGEVFKWQTMPSADLIATETGLISDPQEVR